MMRLRQLDVARWKKISFFLLPSSCYLAENIGSAPIAMVGMMVEVSEA
jgi:hypothetical protein